METKLFPIDPNSPIAIDSNAKSEIREKYLYKGLVYFSNFSSYYYYIEGHPDLIYPVLKYDYEQAKYYGRKL